MTQKETIIRNIENLFPIDSEFPETNAVGFKLLAEAKYNVGYKDNWRDLPENVLREYERLCIAEDNRQCREAAKF